MKAIPQKLILFLIADDLLNFKLVRGLEKLDLNSHRYFMKIDVVIFELLGFNEKQDHEHFTYYLKRRREVSEITLQPDRSALNALALDIYNNLMERRHSHGQ
jgi:hypothetical protein